MRNRVGTRRFFLWLRASRCFRRLFCVLVPLDRKFSLIESVQLPVPHHPNWKHAICLTSSCKPWQPVAALPGIQGCPAHPLPVQHAWDNRLWAARNFAVIKIKCKDATLNNYSENEASRAALSADPRVEREFLTKIRRVKGFCTSCWPPVIVLSGRVNTQLEDTPRTTNNWLVI